MLFRSIITSRRVRSALTDVGKDALRPLLTKGLALSGFSRSWEDNRYSASKKQSKFCANTADLRKIKKLNYSSLMIADEV